MHRTRWLAVAVICLFAAIAIAGLRVQSSKTSLAGSASPASSGISDSWLLSDRVRPRYFPDLAPFVQPGELQPAAWAARPTMKEGAVPDAPAVEAHAAVVVDEASARVLYEKDADRRLPPASLTKIVTAILAVQVLDPAQLVTVDVDSRTMKGSSVMGLLPGDTLSANELLLGLMLPSGNDAALALGRAIAGSDAAFVERMNELVRELGLANTRFRNPHGLNAPGHYSSAYDLAMLARYAMSNPNFAALVATPSATVTARQIQLRNGNSFLRNYAGADGVKIGFTNQAGNTLVASASRNGHRLYVVVLNTTQRDIDAAALMDWAFDNYSWPGD